MFSRPEIGLAVGPWITRLVVRTSSRMSASGPTQTAILGLAKELRVETFKTYAKGKTVLAVGGGRLTAGLDDRGKSEDIR